MTDLNFLVAQYHHFKIKNPQIDSKKIAFKLSSYPVAVREFILWQYNPKAAEKLGKYLPAVLPASLHVEQASGWQAADFKAQIIGQNRQIIDLTGGLGIDAMAFSRHNQVLHIERNAVLQAVANQNFNALNCPNIQSRHADARELLAQKPTPDWFYIDPDRRASQGSARVAFQHSEPNLLEIKDQLLSLARIGVLVKSSPMIDISLACRQLEHVTAVYVFSLHNECKEVLFVLEKAPKALQIQAVEWEKNVFAFAAEQEQTAQATFTQPQSYLYEPWASVMKAAPFKWLCQRFAVNKLASDTHLYTSEELRPDFPGRIFKILSYQSKPELLQANIATRNYPLSVEQLRQKFKIKEGGADYLFACTLMDGSKKIIHARRLSSS